MNLVCLARMSSRYQHRKEVEEELGDANDIDNPEIQKTNKLKSMIQILQVLIKWKREAAKKNSSFLSGPANKAFSPPEYFLIGFHLWFLNLHCGTLLV